MAIVHLPSGYRATTPVPLVLNMHGSQSTALAQEFLTGMDATSDADDFIVAYPQGDIAAGRGFEWNVPGQPLVGGAAVPADAPDDVSFLEQLVTLFEQKYCVAEHRVYATGFSGGARMASQLGCDASTVFAAVAPVSGLRFPSPCPSTRPVPVISFHGTADPVDPFAGHGQAYWTYSVPVAAQRWGAHNGCAPKPAVSDPDPGVTLTAYGKCAGGSAVELYAIAGEGHEWPGGPHLPSRSPGCSGPRARRSAPTPPCGRSSSPTHCPDHGSPRRRPDLVRNHGVDEPSGPQYPGPVARGPLGRSAQLMAGAGLTRIRVCGGAPECYPMVVYGVLSLVWAVLGYRLSENDRRVLGRTPWGLPSALWAFFWFLSLLVGLILYLIAHSTGVRQAQQHPPMPGARRLPAPAPACSRGSASASDLFPAYPRPANSQPTAPGSRARQEPPGRRHRLLPARRGRRHELAPLATGMAPRSQREISLPVVGRSRVDVAGLDRRAPSDRHQSRSAHRAVLTTGSVG